MIYIQAERANEIFIMISNLQKAFLFGPHG